MVFFYILAYVIQNYRSFYLWNYEFRHFWNIRGFIFQTNQYYQRTMWLYMVVQAMTGVSLYPVCLHVVTDIDGKHALLWRRSQSECDSTYQCFTDLPFGSLLFEYNSFCIFICSCYNKEETLMYWFTFQIGCTDWTQYNTKEPTYNLMSVYNQTQDN